MLLLFLVLPILYVGGGAYTETYPRPFDSRSWISGAEMDDDRRCGMLADLKLRIGLTGKTRSQITALLGPPIEWREEPKQSRWLLCPSFMDVWVLAIRWENGRAVEALVHDT